MPSGVFSNGPEIAARPGGDHLGGIFRVTGAAEQMVGIVERDEALGMFRGHEDIGGILDPHHLVPRCMQHQKRPAQTGDGALATRAVLQGDDEVLPDLRVFGAVVGDVALALEDLGDVHLDLRRGQCHLVVVRRVGVTQTRQEVCDRVSHGHG